MNVLFLNDTGLIGGAERCLLDLLAVLDREVEPLVACPRGPLLHAVAALGIEAVPMRTAAAGLRLHPGRTPRAVAQLALLSVAARSLTRDRGTELIHANTLRSCLVAAGARRLGAPPVAAFVHDALGAGRAEALTSRVVRSHASVLFANSAYSADRFGIDIDDPRRRVVFNPIDLSAFDADRLSGRAARAALGLDPDDLVLAVVAQITPWKRQRDALEIVDALTRDHPHVRLLVVGQVKFVGPATRYDNRAYLGALRRLVRERSLEDRVEWLGERADVPAILAATDVLLAPSLEEPFGRAVIEGMAMGCLVVASAVGGPAETITDGVDGLLLPPGDPPSWAAAIGAALADSEVANAMRRAARRTAARFDRQQFARAMLEGYRAALDRS
jgi:glycosyltransferase involved in cell wall biosynthesis